MDLIGEPFGLEVIALSTEPPTDNIFNTKKASCNFVTNSNSYGICLVFKDSPIV